jgi:hypothetical protein
MAKSFEQLVRELVKEIQLEELELEEATTTANVDGYNTPNAFKNSDGTDEDDEPENSYIDKINTSTGYKRVDENRWLNLKREESTPNQKIGKGISTIKSQLSEIEKFIEWYSKIKSESGLDRTSYWKRTHRNLNGIKERLNKITQRIHEL